MIIRWQLQSVRLAIKCHYLQNYTKGHKSRVEIGFLTIQEDTKGLQLELNWIVDKWTKD